MPKALLTVAMTTAMTALLVSAQAPPPGPAPTAAPIGRFAGVWVGRQGWAIANPPPGARQDQPVTLTLQVVNGRISGTLTPFLGGEEGATIVSAVVVGDELQATAVVGSPRAGGRRGGAPTWKDTVGVQMAFKNDGVRLTGRADVTMSEVPWLSFRYDLSKRRSRY